MIMRRAFILLLLIFGLVLPPVAAGMSGAMAAPMEDCKGKSSDQSPCCDTKSTCPVQFCALKSFKAVGAWGPPPLLRVASVPDWPQEPAWPPGLIVKPEPPPPRD
jgi:hypothetical protein